MKTHTPRELTEEEIKTASGGTTGGFAPPWNNKGNQDLGPTSGQPGASGQTWREQPVDGTREKIPS